jgi:hypothetical protein
MKINENYGETNPYDALAIYLFSHNKSDLLSAIKKDIKTFCI